MTAESNQNDIPVWLEGTQRWMTGLTKRTTCDDVIYALLVSTGLHETESTDNFAIFEKWREVERPLSARTKLLKVWSSWGEEQANVQLSMRSLNDYFLPGESSLYMRSRRRHKRSNRNRERHTRQCKCHDQRDYSEKSRLRAMELLVKLVVGQERHIQDLNDRIYDTDRLIDKHEARIHLNRVQQNGQDYVQKSYLNSHSSSYSSSSADSYNFSKLGIKDLKTVFRESSPTELQEIAHVCDSLTHVERRILQEGAKIEEMDREMEKLAGVSGVGDDMDEETDEELEEARVELIRAVTTYVTNEYNERELDRKIEVCLGELAKKSEYLELVGQELRDLDNDLREGSCQGAYSSSYHDNNCSSKEITAEKHFKNRSLTQPTKVQDITRTDTASALPESWQVSDRATPDCQQHVHQNGDMAFQRQHSAPNIRSVQASCDIPVDFPKACSTDRLSVSRRTSVPDKDCANSPNLKSASTDSGHPFETSIYRGRSVNRFKDVHEQKLYNRSRSSERAFSECQSAVQKFETAPTSVCENPAQSRDQTRQDQRTFSARTVIDQYGLEPGSDLNGHSPRHFIKQSSCFLPSNASAKEAVTASEIEGKHKLQNGVSASTDNELDFSGDKQQWRERKDYTYGHRENRHRGVSAQTLSPSYSTLDQENENASHAISLYIPSEEECNTLFSKDTYSKNGVCFDENSDLTNRKPYTSSSIQRQASNEEPIKLSNSTTNHNYLVNKRDLRPSPTNTTKTAESERRGQLFETPISSPIKNNCFEKSRETDQEQGAKFLQESIYHISGITLEGKQTRQELKNQVNDDHDRPGLQENRTRNGFRQRDHTSVQNHINDGMCKQFNFESSNNEITNRLYARRLSNSRLHISGRSPHGDSTVISSISGGMDTSQKCGLCFNKSTVCVHNVDSIYLPQCSTADQPNKEPRPKINRTDGYSNKSTDASSAQKRRPIKNGLTSTLMNQEMTQSHSNQTTPDANTSRGALYHIVSNKINKPKAEPSDANQTDTKDSDVLGSSATKQPTNKPPAIERTNSTDVDSGIFNDKDGSQGAQMYSNRELFNSYLFSCNSGEKCNSPSTFSYNSGDKCNSPSTFSYNSGDKCNSPSTLSYNSGDKCNSPSTLSYNSGDKCNTDSNTTSTFGGERYRSPSTFSNKTRYPDISHSTFSCTGVEHHTGPSTPPNSSIEKHSNSPSYSHNTARLDFDPFAMRYSNTEHPPNPPQKRYTSNRQPSNGVSLVSYSEDKIGNSHVNNATTPYIERQNALHSTIVDRPMYSITGETQPSNQGNMNHNCVNLSNIQSRTPFPSNTTFQNSVNQHIGDCARDLIEPVHTNNINFSNKNVYFHNHSSSFNKNATTSNIVLDVKNTKLDDINDSNSDTGLSSMHSDETHNLETLV